MKPKDLAEMMALAAIWGASFLFMRVAVPDFGTWALVWVRVGSALLVLWPLLLQRGEWGAMRAHWKPIAVVGVTNSALPFLCFAYAAMSITAGLSAILNATTPLWAALIAAWWLKDRLTPARIAGLAVGFASVVWLAWDKASFKPGGTGWAVLACLAATSMYGFSASWTKKRLTGVPAVTLATGSQLSAAVVLLLPALLHWPATQPGALAWSAALALGVFCSAVAYIMYFRLLARIGPARAVSVTFLIPVFAVLWGGMLLGEAVTPSMLLGGLVILVGTALAMGLWPRPAPAIGDKL